ncbi:unnamed protein product [Arabis nemorensis]|uniref:F-box domain-containing protein n=1 Tax=Arabis nemorensis TaxID=586526 RepID=A0A565C709_9BRAS|nr:unnamed protein product [Arabis nemorensis]
MSGAKARKISREMLRLEEDNAPRIGTSLSQPERKKLLIVGTKPKTPDPNLEPCSDSEEEEKDASDDVPKLLYEVEVEIFARVSCFEYWKLHFLNKQFSQLLKSGEIFKVKQERGLLKPYVLMLTSGDPCWTMIDKSFENFRKLPEISSDFCFFAWNKETISAGTQLLVIGKEVESIVVWRYELEMHKWTKGPSMITPRVMYGSATRGTDAFFAGGIKYCEKGIPEVASAVEKYNADTKTWTMICEMHKRRKFSSGCFLRGKFYVIGGRDENNKYLICGESYDEVKNSWTLIPDMLKDVTFKSSQSPPLIAVVNDNLYLLDTSSNELQVYDVNTNVWKKLGIAPVKANGAKGWGVAFKSIGDRLLVIGASSARSCSRKMAVYTCRPSPNMEEQLWEETKNCCDGVELTSFIHNCCVMFA